VTSPIVKKTTVFRETFMPREQLSVPLFYLETCRIYEDLKIFVPVSLQAGLKLPEVCKSVHMEIRKKCLKIRYVL
jgi:hypothetical protein